jgi:VWFA-related protein
MRNLASFGTGIVLFAAIFLPSAAAQQQPSQQAPPPQTQSPQGQNPAPKAPAAAAPARQQGPTRAQISRATNLVIVPVSVKDRQGQLVGGLQKEDFRILADNVEQKILYFSSEPFPLSAVILIDNNLSLKSAEQVQKSLTAISAGFGPSDESAVVVYDEFPRTITEFSFGNDTLYTQLHRLELGSRYPGAPLNGPTANADPVINGRTAAGVPVPEVTPNPERVDMDDAIFAAGSMLHGRGRDRRKIIFLISDGNDSHNNTHTFDQTLQLLLENDVSVYSISVGHALLQHETKRLEHYANSTGGDTFSGGNQRSLERLYSQVTEEARNQYMLTFSPDDVKAKQDYHSIEVRVERPNLDVTARQGYYQSAEQAQQ